MQKNIAEVGHPTFLAGMRSTTGWWYYYAACFFLKMPAAFWPILMWAGIGIVRGKEKDRRRAELILIVSSVALVAASSFLSKSQAGFRYVLASLPPLFVISGAVVMNAAKAWKKVALAALLCLYAAPALLAHPHHIAYFSELVGGPKNGYKWLSDSNLDWGQDLERARDYVRKSDVPITVNPGIMPVSGRILINATTLQDTFTTCDIHGWLRAFKPVDYVGYSWLVFDIGEETIKERVNSPDFLRADYYRAAFEYERDHLGSAAMLANSILMEKPAMPEALYLLGLSQMGFGQLEEARNSFGGILPAHPLYVDARSNMSFIATVMGNGEESNTYRKQSMAEDMLRSYARRPSLPMDENVGTLEAARGDWRLLNNLGVSEWARGMLPDAEKHIRDALEVRPNFVEAYANLAIVLEEGKLFDDALRAVNDYESNLLLLKTTPYRDYRVYYQDTRVMMGDTLELFPKPDAQVLQIKAHLTRHPEDVFAANLLAVVLMKRGRFAEAFDTLSRAIEQNPRSGALYTNLAVLYTEKKMFPHALAACEKALEIDPGNSSTAELLSSITKRLEDSE
ncbi:MAG: tetratricopeptide repeat protein [Candidatus Lindowbacteria bacterium]|nr:tetratricopeptide repeat protein [Candidatus Lindowbacteria bacterium]